MAIFEWLTGSSAGRGCLRVRSNALCVPGTAHVLKGESNISFRQKLGKSQTQPDGGEGYSVIARGHR